MALDEAAVERLSEETTEKYRRYVNPGIANILNFGGFQVPEERAEGCYIWDASGRQVSRLRRRLRCVQPGALAPQGGRGGQEAARKGGAQEPLLHVHRACRRLRAARKRVAGRHRVLVPLQLRHGGRGGRAEMRAQAHRPAGVHRRGQWLPRQDLRQPFGVRPRRLQAGLRTAAAGNQAGSLRRRRRARRRNQRPHRRGDPRSHPGRGWGEHRSRRLLHKGPRDMRCQRRSAHPRRSPHGLRPHGQDVRKRAL